MQALKTRLFLRFHMSLILIGTALIGLLSSKLLLMAQVTNMAIRYPLAVVVSYLAFFGFVKLWLSYIAQPDPRSSSFDALDLVNVPDVPNLFPGVRVPSGSFGGGGGGTGGGGGVSGSFEVAGPDSPGSAAAAGEAASGILEDAGWVLIVLGLLLAIVFGSGLYMIYDAPFILSEAAFEFLLSAGLIKSMKKIDHAEWTGSVFRTTWKPFTIVLLISLIAACIIHSQYPEAHRLSEIFRR